MSISILLFLLSVVLYFLYKTKRTPSTVLYEDKGRSSRVLVDPVNRIRSKPDMIKGPKHSALLIEYKSRDGKVYPSDIAQAYAGVLAARADGIVITRAEVHTKSQKYTLPAIHSNESIVSRISDPLNSARIVASGGVPTAKPQLYKCRSCSYKKHCPHAIL